MEHEHQYVKMNKQSFTDYTKHQIVGNFKMVRSYSRCWLDIERNGKAYDLFVRLRDDVGFATPLNVKVLSEQGLGLKLPTIITSKFLSNGGINDRLAFVSPSSAKCYFNMPYIKFFDGSNLDSAMYNSESYFKRIYWHTRCAEIRTSSEFNPQKIFNGRFLCDDKEGISHPSSVACRNEMNHSNKFAA